MSKYGEYIKSVKERELQKFFGEIKKVSNQYFTFHRIQDKDNIILITKNVKWIKDSPCLIVGSDKAVYLKDWNVWEVHSYDEGFNAYAVKLSRKYFKVYTFKSPFEDFIIEKDQTFDDLYQIAQEQEEENLKIATGSMH